MNAPSGNTAAPSTAPAERSHQTIHRFLVKPVDAGTVGSVDGGKLLEWIDKVAFAAAAQWSGRYCVTAYVGNVHFDRPIHVGELVELHATLVHTGRTSMHILVTVYSSDPTQPQHAQTSQCLLIFVAVDDAGAPVNVPRWDPPTMLDQQRQRQARMRISLRKRIEAAMAAQTYTAEGTAPRTTLRFLAAPTDVNWGGKVHGGRVMQWIDEAAYVCGADWAGAQVISSYIAGVRFYRPINIGNVIEVTARIVHTGPRSIHTSVHVATTNTYGADPLLAAHAMTVFVSLDDRGKTRPVPMWTRLRRGSAAGSTRPSPNRTTPTRRTVHHSGRSAQRRRTTALPHRQPWRMILRGTRAYRIRRTLRVGTNAGGLGLRPDLPITGRTRSDLPPMASSSHPGLTGPGGLRSNTARDGCR